MAKTLPSRKRIKQYVDQNPVEAFRDLGINIARSVKDDVVGSSVDTLWKQFLGGNEKPREQLSGELTPGVEIDLRETKTVQEFAQPGLAYHQEIKTAEIKVVRENQTELGQKIAQIQFELKKLVNSSKELQVVFKEVSVETVPAKPGKYHLNFVEWLLSVIRQARLKVDESRSWLTTLYNRRAKKQYWNMFKKHGTTFGLSQERVVATQTG